METLFFRCLRHFSRRPSSRLVEMYPSVQKRKTCLLFRAFLHVSGNYYLNDREVYLKLCHWQPFFFLLVKTDFLAGGNHFFLPFSDTPATTMLQTHHMHSTLRRRGNDRFRVVSTWNTRGVFLA